MTHKPEDAKKYFDPLYGAVTFRNRFYGRPFWASMNFHELVGTAEFNRLKYIRQEGLVWLEFPYVSYTRFSGALASWYLADWTASNVRVRRRGSSDIDVLGDELSRLKWFEEFHLALLLHDIGHFPFTFTIENNDRLIGSYGDAKASQGVLLDHKNFSKLLARGPVEDSAGTAGQFRKFTSAQIWSQSDEAEKQSAQPPAFVSDLLLKASREGAIDIEKIMYLMTPNAPWDPIWEEADEKVQSGGSTRDFIQLVRNLVIGAIDLGTLDRFNRLSYFVSGRSGALPVTNFLSSLMLVDDDKFVVSSDGINDAFSIIYTVKQKLRRSVTQNTNVKAYETMVNYALTRHYEYLVNRPGIKPDSTLKQKSHGGFCKYFPFYEDGQFFRELMGSDDLSARRAMQRVRSGNLFICLGHYRLVQAHYESLFANADAPTRHGRRAQVREAFLRESEFIRGIQEIADGIHICLTRKFGERTLAESPVGTSGEPGDEAAVPEWMSMDHLFVEHETTEGRGHRPISEFEDHGSFVKVIAKMEQRMLRGFWIFVETEDKAEIKKIRERVEILLTKHADSIRLETR